MFKFAKSNTTKYLLTDYDAGRLSKIVSFLDEISTIDGVNEFNEFINNDLYEKVLARTIATDFIKKYREAIDKEHHIVITISIHDKTYNMTIGKFNLQQDNIGYIYDMVRI